jgi:hypothetical protein
VLHPTQLELRVVLRSNVRKPLLFGLDACPLFVVMIIITAVIIIEELAPSLLCAASMVARNFRSRHFPLPFSLFWA